MASNVTNRQTVRERLATKIDAAFNTDWDVFNYKTISFAGKSRNIVIASGDTDYPQEGAGAEEVADSDYEFDFAVMTFIEYANTALSWTSQNSEDALDLARKTITDVIRDNRIDSGYWDWLHIIARSRVGLVSDLQGVPYKYESIIVRAKHYA